MKTKFFLLLLLTICLTALAEDQELVDMSEPKRCLSLRSIDKTKIVSENQILFYARGKKLFSNTLARKCGGLHSDSILSYSANMGRLCNRDIVIIQDRGAGQLVPGSHCILGMFEQIPKLEVLRDED